MLCHLHVTTATILLSYVHRQNYYAPLLLTNAVVGCFYMQLERDAILELGMPAFSRVRVHLTYLENLFVNLLFHGVFTVACLDRLRPHASARKHVTCALTALGLLAFDLEELYPTQIHPIHMYVGLYLITLSMILFTGLVI